MRKTRCLAGALVALLAGAAAAAEVGSPWPRTFLANDTKFVFYQPQVTDWKDYRELDGKIALAITPKDAKAPVFGVLDVRADTRTDFEARTVYLFNLRILSVRFPSLDPAQSRRMEELVRKSIDGAPRTVPLDPILLSLQRTQAQARAESFLAEPPVIFASQKPAVLVVLDGDPVLTPIEGTDLLYAVNTNWDLFLDRPGNTYYLLRETSWLTAPAVEGPWRPAGALPADFKKLPATEQWANVRANVPGRPLSAAQMPAVFVSTKPAELIMTQGAPALTPIKGTKLLYVANTDSDLFFHGGDQRHYYLVSGRWFRAAGLQGPWAFATPNLPPDFVKIPVDHPRGRVLVSVPGTPQAEEAVLQAQVPRQVTVKRSEAKLEVTYSGEPEFKPIQGTTMYYAANTPYDVIRVGDLYYACFQGLWFLSTSPKGPWSVAPSVPQVIYTIPPSYPVYHTTYVYVYDSTPDQVVVGFTSGYMMGFVMGAVLVHGTGYYYPPYVWRGPVPVYYPYARSYGVWASYNPYSGTYARGGTVYGPYGAATAGAAYNPRTGTYARGAAAYGPYGGASAVAAYNPRTGAYARGGAVWGPEGGTAGGSFYNPRTGVGGATRQNWSPYAQWGSSVVSGPGGAARGAHYTDARGTVGGFQSTTGAAGVGYAGSEGSRGGAVRTSGGDVYAGKDGNVYKRSEGGWSKYDSGSWNSVKPPAEVNTDWKARTQGNQRAQSYSGSAGTRAGSARGRR